MIGYHTPVLTAIVPTVDQAFDSMEENPSIHAKYPSLEDYDYDRPNDDNDWLSVALDRWGDLRVPR